MILGNRHVRLDPVCFLELHVHCADFGTESASTWSFRHRTAISIFLLVVVVILSLSISLRKHSLLSLVVVLPLLPAAAAGAAATGVGAAVNQKYQGADPSSHHWFRFF
jgi:hypothetical protein